MNKKFIIPAVLIILFGIIVFVYSRSDSPSKKGETIETTGLIETTEVEISPKITEKIVWLCCREGDIVSKGSPLIRMDKEELKARLDERKAMLKGAEAGYDTAKANLENAEARVESAMAEIKVAESEVERIKAIFEEARDNFNRISELFRQGYASKKDMDSARALYDSTNAQFNAAIAKRRSLEAALSTAKAGFRAAEAQVKYSDANIDEAQAQLKVIETQLKDTELLSPIEGVIAYKSFEEGETVPSGKSIYTIYDLKKIWARVDIEETEAGRLKLGDSAIVKTDALPDKGFDGEIIEIGKEAEFATQRDVTRGRQDIKTFRVKVAIKNPDGILKPGMTVMVRFK
jgi:HlyD family secretion protein